MPLTLDGSNGISATGGSQLIGANQIGTTQLQDNAVTTPKIAADAVATVDIANGAVTTAKIADANVTTAKIADANVTVAKLSATGTPSASTFLRGDGSWQAPTGGVTSVATGNGLTGGTITTSGTLSITAAGYQTVGSYLMLVSNSGVGGLAANTNYSGQPNVNIYASDSISSVPGTWRMLGAVSASGSLGWLGVRVA